MTAQRRTRSAAAHREAVARRREAAARRREASRAAWQVRHDAGRARHAAQRERVRQSRQVSLVDLVDRLLDGGVVIQGDITLAVADVDLLYVGLGAIIASVDTMERATGVRPTAKSRVLGLSAF